MASAPREDNFTRFLRLAGAGRQDFWFLRWLYGRRRGERGAGAQPGAREGQGTRPDKGPVAA
jgi:hypothetical protein